MSLMRTKQLRILLPLLFIALCSAGQGVPKGKKKDARIDSAGVFPTGIQKGKTKNAGIALPEGNDILLVYTGSVTGMMNIDIGIHVEIDSSVGVRYEVVYERGTAVLAHTALFYKFSTPFQSVLYDFRTHESTINNLASASGESKLNVMGPAVIDSFHCTLLQGTNTEHGTTNYWMSKEVPGYFKLLNILKNVNPLLPGMAIDGNIFAWGGLVRMTANHVDDKGRSINMNLNLIEANPNLMFPSSDFDVPSS